MPVPFRVTIWVHVERQAGGRLEFAKLFGFYDERREAAYWLAALLRTSDGYVMIKSSQEIKSSYFISLESWHEYTVQYDGNTLAVFVDDMLVLTDISATGLKALGAVNLGVLDTKAPEIGYGTVYVDDYSVELPILIVQTKTETSVTTTTLEVVPTHIYWSLP